MGTTVTFRKRDLETAIAVAHQNGLTVTGTEILRNGTIRLLYGKDANIMGNRERPEGVDNLEELVSGEDKPGTA